MAGLILVVGVFALVVYLPLLAWVLGRFVIRYIRWLMDPDFLAREEREGEARARAFLREHTSCR